MVLTDGATGFAKPATIEELRNLTVSINRENANISLGNKALDVLAKLVDTPEQTAVRTISELADTLGVNPSTLTRLSQKLGFTGFSDLQSVFRQAFSADDRYFYSRQAGRLLSTKEDSEEELHIFDRLGLETKNNIDGFLTQLDPKSLLEAAGLLANARRVRVHGVRQFHAFASFLTYGLGMLRSDVSLLDAPRLGVAEALAQLEKGDVVVVASCAPYTRSVANVAEVAAKLGLAVIAVTDTRASPSLGRRNTHFSFPTRAAFSAIAWGPTSCSVKVCSISSRTRWVIAQ
ncbi:Helix-turn-helix domain, rpiR family protein (plasmid) [Rhizobium leguminosarum]|uniref:Helix-turn-helix domain, rpiR family protein n=1 Tax=Rhizobium leguminosarum TaxID=384 RepID=A0A2Z4YLR1_RHILE|nr:Helix-turn-helix domain, rpiR family protein [Rhizobium leguminosarum]